LKLQITKDKLIARVIDQGIGIPQNEQASIFGKFFRASNAFRVRERGTGLGLYLSKIFMNAHEGEIKFESEEGKGTVFSLSLPLREGSVSEDFLKKL